MALRFGVTALVARREFAVFRLDMNAVPEERRQVLPVAVHVSLLEFVGLADITVPMIAGAHEFAEKLHTVSRSYAIGDSRGSVPRPHQIAECKPPLPPQQWDRPNAGS